MRQQPPDLSVQVGNPLGWGDGPRGAKGPAVYEFLERLSEAGREWDLQDHWGGDLCAVGRSTAADGRREGYVIVGDVGAKDEPWQCSPAEAVQPVAVESGSTLTPELEDGVRLPARGQPA